MKIIGSDYDGTFTIGDLKSKESAISEWQRQGNKFGIISDRGKRFYRELVKTYPKIKFDFLAANNSRYIMDRNGEAFYEARCCKVAVPMTAITILK